MLPTYLLNDAELEQEVELVWIRPEPLSFALGDGRPFPPLVEVVFGGGGHVITRPRPLAPEGSRLTSYLFSFSA